MDPSQNLVRNRTKQIIMLIVILALVSGILGWWLGRSDGASDTQSNTNTQSGSQNSQNAQNVKSLVNYSLPDGWKESSCPSVVGSIFIVPAGADGVDCNASPSSPVKISVDPASSKDCNELQNVQEVKKHVCKSLYINGLKTLKAETEYLASSSYKQATTINAYYVDAKNGVIKAEYVFNSDNQYQAGFDQLASSIKLKN